MFYSPTTKNFDKKRAVSLFDEFFNDFLEGDYRSDTRMMALDILEQDDKFIVKADLPGIEKENVKISTKESLLVIEAECKKEDTQEKETYHRRERFTGFYQRTINLSDICDVEHIKAKLDNGVLHVEIPKVEPKPVKDIIIE
jgi:HSP20 family protein